MERRILNANFFSLAAKIVLSLRIKAIRLNSLPSIRNYYSL